MPTFSNRAERLLSVTSAGLHEVPHSREGWRPQAFSFLKRLNRCWKKDMNGLFIKVTGSLAKLFKSIHLPLLIASVVASMMLVGASFQPPYALSNLTEQPEVVASPGQAGANLDRRWGHPCGRGSL